MSTRSTELTLAAALVAAPFTAVAQPSQHIDKDNKIISRTLSIPNDNQLNHRTIESLNCRFGTVTTFRLASGISTVQLVTPKAIYAAAEECKAAGLKPDFN